MSFSTRVKVHPWSNLGKKIFKLFNGLVIELTFNDLRLWHGMWCALLNQQPTQNIYVMPICMASYMTASYGHANHAFRVNGHS
jgi:hypothetical protein